MDTMATTYNLRNLLNLPYVEHDAAFVDYPSVQISSGPFTFSGNEQLHNGAPLSFIRIHWSSNLPPTRARQAEAWYMGSLGADYVNKVFVKTPAFVHNSNSHYHLITFPGLTLNNHLSDQQNVSFNNGNISKNIHHRVETYPLVASFQGSRTIDWDYTAITWDIATEELALTLL